MKDKRKFKILYLLLLYVLKQVRKIKIYQDKPPYRKKKFIFDYSKLRVDKKVLVYFE